MKKIILMLAGALLIAACSNNDDTGTLPASNADRDWFAIEDSADPLDHARYEIYEKFGISVFCTDTLGVEARGTNGYGDPIVHVEMLDPLYNVTNITENIKYALSTDRDALLKAVELFRDAVIPNMIPGDYPRAVLLVDNITMNNPLNTTETWQESIYNGSRCMVIGRIAQLETMTADEQKTFAINAAATRWYDYAIRSYPDDMEQFFAVSEREWLPVNSTNPTGGYDVPKPAYPTAYDQQLVIPTPLNQGSPSVPTLGTPGVYYRDNWTCYGFITNSTTHPATGVPISYGQPNIPGVYSWWSPTRKDDGISYFAAVLSHKNVDEFYAEWENSEYATTVTQFVAYSPYRTGNRWMPLLKTKFNMIDKIVVDIKIETAQ